MGRWCERLPVVVQPRSAVPNPVTLIVPYYECPVFFHRQLEIWNGYQSKVRDYLRIIVVDDGSPTMPLTHAEIPPNMRVFRIEQDVRWNWLAARNIGALEAVNGWLLLTDMDHVIPEETMEAVIYGVINVGIIYGFSRVEHTGAMLEPHKNSWLITRDLFWNVGGYDEALSGHYGTDGDWRRRCAATAPMAILQDHLVRHEFVGDSSVTKYKRKQPEDVVAQRMIKSRSGDWKPRVLSFPYHEVCARVACSA